MPSVVLAHGRVVHIVGAVVDGQVQGDNTVATVLVSESLCISSRIIIAYTIPDVLFADGSVHFYTVRLVNGELQRVRACATEVIFVIVSVCSGIIVTLSVPIVVVTRCGSLRVMAVRGNVNSQ